jgi:hypothetical protein
MGPFALGELGARLRITPLWATSRRACATLSLHLFEGRKNGKP